MSTQAAADGPALTELCHLGPVMTAISRCLDIQSLQARLRWPCLLPACVLTLAMQVMRLVCTATRAGIDALSEAFWKARGAAARAETLLDSELS